MRRKLFVLIYLLFVLLITACINVNEEFDGLEGPVLTFRTVSDSPETRTVLMNDGSILWNPGDAIKIFYGDQSGIFVSTNKKPASSVTFTGTLGRDFALDDNKTFLAVYPSERTSPEVNADGTTFSVVIAPDQPAEEGTFANDIFPSAARSKNFDLYFYNLCGGVKFSLANSGVKKVVFRGNNNERLAGMAVFKFPDRSVPKFSHFSSYSNNVTLTASDDKEMKPGVWYYLATVPCSLSKGYTLELHYADGRVEEISSNKPVEIKRAKWGILANQGKTSSEEAPDAIDLGLPSGLKWASCNLGASASEEYGDYYAWGETEPNKNNYSWETYIWCKGSESSLTKYNYNDGKSSLEQADDAAYVRLGGKWRMPTKSEWQELIDNCSWTTKTNGVLATSKKTGATIFFPFSGQKDGKEMIKKGTSGYYWTSTLSPFSSLACLGSTSPDSGDVYLDRYKGISIRPVYGEANTSTDISTHEAIDLGLTSGLKWATCNVGASAPEEYGDFFAWGETAPYYTSGHSQDNPCSNWKAGKSAGYDWTSYKWCNGSFTTLAKYCTKNDHGTVDNKTVLDPEDDAASVNWGGNWRMPTDEEWTELRTECTWKWTTQNGVKGRVATGPNGKSIFLPAAGDWSYTSFGGAGYRGSYWSSSLLSIDPSRAWDVGFYSGAVNRGSAQDRIDGLSVRPVSPSSISGIRVKSVSLNKTSLILDEGSTATLIVTVLPENATNKTVTWLSDKPSCATVSSSGAVTAVSSGTAVITVTTADGGFTASCTVKVNSSSSSDNRAVDLGLPSGLKWASCNVGASAPEEYGNYYAWGETSPKTDYSWSTYMCSNVYPQSDYDMVLDPEDDAASVNWGGSWRMPTASTWDELIDECTWTWTTLNGVRGWLVTGPNNNSIFLPAAGRRDGTGLDFTGSQGYYWSSVLSSGNLDYSWCLFFYPSQFSNSANRRYYGQSVRPVLPSSINDVRVKSVSLNITSLTLDVGVTVTLTATVSPENATNKKVTWSSDNVSVANVSSSGVVTAVSSGTAVITVTTADGGYTAKCTVKINSSSSSDIQGAVDLGLPSGLKWASCNVGASAPEEYGDYFAWGETEPYYEVGHAQSDSPVWKSGKSAGYNWASYGLCKGSTSTLKKYCTYSDYGTVDNRTVLDPEDDAAYVNLGNNWRMPTNADWTELCTECTWTWITRNGVYGRLVTSNTNGNSIFLPSAGGRLDNELYNAGSGGTYWSSSLRTYVPYCAWYVYFDEEEILRTDGYRYGGFSIRAVSE